MEQGNAIPLFVMLFLSAGNRYTNGSTAADNQQRKPQCGVGGVAGAQNRETGCTVGVGCAVGCIVGVGCGVTVGCGVAVSAGFALTVNLAVAVPC